MNAVFGIKIPAKPLPFGDTQRAVCFFMLTLIKIIFKKFKDIGRLNVLTFNAITFNLHNSNM